MKLHIILFLFFVLTLCFPCNSKSDDKINKTIVQRFDITGDNVSDKIVLNYFGDSIQHPFSWTLKIYSREKIIFSSPKETYAADEVFSNPEYFEGNCKSFEQCKLQFFNVQLLQYAFKTQKEYMDIILDKKYPGSIWFVAKDNLMDEFHIPEEKTDTIIKNMVKELKSRTVILMFFPVSPFLSELPRMYVEEVQGFVIVYSW